MTDRLVTTSDASKALKVSIATIHVWGNKEGGPRPKLKAKRQHFWDLDELVRYKREAGRRFARDKKQRQRETSHHGTRARYNQGCRCDRCRAANASYMRQFKKRKRGQSATTH